MCIWIYVVRIYEHTAKIRSGQVCSAGSRRSRDVRADPRAAWRERSRATARHSEEQRAEPADDIVSARLPRSERIRLRIAASTAWGRMGGGAAGSANSSGPTDH